MMMAHLKSWGLLPKANVTTADNNSWQIGWYCWEKRVLALYCAQYTICRIKVNNKLTELKQLWNESKVSKSKASKNSPKDCPKLSKSRPNNQQKNQQKIGNWENIREDFPCAMVATAENILLQLQSEQTCSSSWFSQISLSW